MIATEHTQSLDSFRQRADETLNRLDQTGRPEVLTVDGRPRAVLLSPAAYDEMAREAELSRDAAVIRQAMAEYRAGQGQSLDVVSAEIRARVPASFPGPVGTAERVRSRSSSPRSSS